MPGWLSTILQGAGIAVITAVIVGLYRRWRAAAHRADLQAGRALTFDASIRADAAPYPRRWRTGWVTAGVGAPTWKPRFSILRRRIALPMSAVVDQIRGVSGLRETFIVNPDCRIIVARSGDLRLELAVLEIELATALQALESTTGGGWQIPHPVLIEIDQESEDPQALDSR